LDQIKEDEMGGACSTHGNGYNILIGKPVARPTAIN
jgi:hypothetical protein